MLLCLMLAPAGVSSAQAQGEPPWWHAAGSVAATPAGAGGWGNVTAGRYYELDRAAAGAGLRTAPLETAAPGQQGVVIVLPRPDGRFERFDVVESPVMAPELAARYPDIKTYSGVGLEDRSATVRVGWSPAGFYAQVLSANGSYYVDPREQGDAVAHVSYFAQDAGFTAPGFTCHVAGEARPPAALSPDIARRAGPTLRNYRVAIATTGEFTAFHGGVAGALNAVVQVVNRLTGIYEVEVGVRMTLVPNNDLVIFTNPATDPFTNADSFAMLFQVQPVLDSVIGSQNYDVGHVFGTDFAPNGVAFLRATCAPTLKGSGVTAAPNPVPSGSWVMVAAHEFGHQFGANHTFNGINGGCGPNRNATTAYEPGSGSTIMSYSSICGPDNLQGLQMMDPHFHSISFDEITAHIEGAGGGCALNITTGNNAPLVSAGTNYTIPANTFFRLTAQATDPDGDFVTYSWEQRDLGPATNLAAGDIGAGPLFRVFNPTSSPVRIFPRLDSILTGTPSVGERLPVFNRTMNFRVTARDGRAAGGGVNTADMQVVVVSNAGPFLITAPTTSANYSGPQTVTWNVANTTNAPISAASVNIWFSVDGGRTFPILLAANTPNDGSELVDVPAVPTTRGRVMVEAAGNIFFDISDNDLTIPLGTQQADLQLSVASPAAAVLGAPFTYTLTVSNAGPDLSAPVLLTNYLPATVNLLSVSNSAGSVSIQPGIVEITSGVLSNGQVVTVGLNVQPTSVGFITNLAVVGAGVPDPLTLNNTAITVTPVAGPTPELSAAGAAVLDESYTPLNGAIEVGERVTVSFAIQNTGIAGAAAISAQLLPGGGVASPGPSGELDYGLIPAGGVIEQPFSFTATGTNGGSITAILLLRQAGIVVKTISYSFNFPTTRTFTSPGGITINNVDAAAPYPSTIEVTDLTGQIAKATVTLNKFTHSFPDDVDILLVSPTGQKVMVFSDAGGGQTVTNLVLTLDDSATNTLPDASALSAGVFRPADYEPGETMLAPAPAGPYAAALATLNQQPPNGTWSLYVQDDAMGDAGSISGGWALNLSTVAPINPAGDLALTLTANTNATVAGQPVTYTLGVLNDGPAVANAVTLTDTLPTGVTVLGATVSQGTFTNLGGQVVFRFGSIATNGSATATLTVIPVTTGLLTNSATVSAARTELTPADNSAEVVTTVGAPTPLILTDNAILTAESFNPPNGAVDPGETVTVSLRLRNAGTLDTTNLVATLQTAGGVQSPSGPQNYGALVAGAGSVGRDFTFTAVNLTNGQVTATLALQDGALDLGTVSFVFSLGGTAKFSSTVPIIIRDHTNAAPYPSTIVVSNVAGVISRVSVVLSNFTHSFPDDVDVLLVGPSGERVVLMSDTGGSTAVSDVTLTLDDAAAQALPDVSGLVTGSFLPTNRAGEAEDADVWLAPAPAGPYAAALAEFNGTDANGTWSLYVMDDSTGDVGQIGGGWCLRFETVSPVSESADLVLSLAVNTNEVVAGNFVTYSFTVTNKGPSAAELVVLSNSVPAGARLTGAFQSQGTLLNVNGQLLAQFGTIERNAAAFLSVTLSPFAAGLLTNAASVSSAQVDFALANNRGEVVINVLPAPQPALGPVAGVSTNGTFDFAITGQPGLSYVIEATTNLIDWVPISTNVPVGGMVTITDTNAAIIPERFYRARQLP